MGRAFCSGPGFGLAAIALYGGLGVALTPALAAQANQRPSIAQALDEFEGGELYIHPAQGRDRATGAEDAPLQTITQALAIAAPGTTIVLAPGRYDRDSGEQFPLQIPDGVTLRGNEGDYGDGVLIYGGGSFVSGAAGQQSAAVIASGRAILSGLTLSNAEGHGLWVEQGAPVVTNCLFWGSGQSGMTIGGGSPTVRHSRFYQNQGSGLLISGTATPLVQANRIEDTGYGLTIQGQAAPRLLQNYISGNRSGVVIQGQAYPTLRSNQIVDNREDGVVTLAQAQPDLGTQGQPGYNEFSSNGQYAVNAAASDQIIAAAGNRFLTGSPASRTSGRVDFSGIVAGEQAALASPAQTPLAQAPVAQAPTAQAPINQGSSSLSAPLPTRQASSTAAIRPALASQAPQQRSTGFERNADLLPVPAVSVPVGHVGGMSTVSAGPGGASARRATLRYRVVVEANSTQDQAIVQAIAPGAFITRVNGRAVMQVGAYQRSENATQMQRQLASRGLRAEVQQVR
ncbi:MAG: DUF1565 domain-containing protein [Elainellaceae cyanobacterium]